MKPLLYCLLIFSTLLTVTVCAHDLDDSERPSKEGDSVADAKVDTDGDKAVGDKADEIVRQSEKGMSIKLRRGKTLDYKVTTAVLPIENAKGEERVQIFHTYYQVESETPRPIVFCFNGGPGAASVWLHLGGIGPYRVALPGDGTTHAKPPYKAVENPYTLLQTADLVFVDPVSTGYSRGKDKKTEREFHGANEDVEANAEFIRRFIAHHKVWDQPIFLMGESYGVFRVAGLVGELQSKFGIRCSGLLLISGLVDFQTILLSPSNDLPYTVFLPTYTRLALRHGALQSDDPEKLIKEAREFASNQYLEALHAGHTLSPELRAEVIEKLVTYTSLPADLIDRSDLRIKPTLFRGMLLDDQNLVLGRFDGRVTGVDSDRVVPHATGDPSFNVIKNVYATAVQDYLVNELGFNADENKHYRVLTGDVWPWNYKDFSNRYAATLSSLQDAVVLYPEIRLFVAGGLYDLATPIEGIEHSLNRVKFPSDDSLVIELYDGGHMMYSNPAALKKLSSDLNEFIESTVND